MTNRLNKRANPTSVYRRIEQDMRGRVLDGTWGVGMMIPSRKRLAEEYGVDLRTMQRAIAGLLSDGTLTAHGTRGTFVAERPEPLREQSQPPLVIGIVVNQLVSPAEVAPRAVSGAIHAAARRSSSHLRILNLDSYADSIDAMGHQESDALDIIEHEGLDGAIIWHSGGERTLSQLQRIVRKGVPIVLIDRYAYGVNSDFVGTDNKYSAVQAVEYLISLGHARIGFLAPMEPVSAIVERLTGYRKALARAGIAHREDLEFRPPFDRCLDQVSLDNEIEKIVQTILQMSEPPTAIFAVNDVLAYHLINALEANGYPVPTRMSVIGFGDIDRYLPRTPFLTTMQQPFEDIGERAAELLLERIALRAEDTSDAPIAYKHILLPTKLVARQSCAPPSPER